MFALLAATLLTAQPDLLPRNTQRMLIREEIALIEDSRTSGLWYLPAGAMFLGGAASMIAGVIMVDPGRCRYSYYGSTACDPWSEARPEALIALGAGAVSFVAGLVLTLVVDNLRYPANSRLEALYKQLSAVM